MKTYYLCSANETSTQANLMATKEQVEAFLKRLKEKIKVFDIIFRDDRGKNLQTLATLEINTIVRKQIIMNIEPEDYVE